jgi:uncharacterized RDD family membrane protein YckC
MYQEDRELVRRLSQRPRWRGYQLSSWWRRVGASLIDGLLVSPASTGLYLLLGGSFGELFDGNDFPLPTGEQWALYGCAALVVFLYFPTVMALTNGQTAGKLVLHIRVVRTDHHRMTFGRATLRELVIKTGLVGTTPVVNPLLSALDGLWPLWDKENRAIHDMLARTRVVRADVMREAAALVP